ncbi:hypothetical protein [Celeribacter sp.]|uniref:hypothetical protein n=1 Tax=Celeribacter sp. TaxID=1890673 RepID=UPI003A919799
MLEIRKAIGPGNWLSEGDAIDRRAAMEDLFYAHPECADQLGEDWPEDRVLHSELVIVEGDTLVATGMLVVDRDRAEGPARIWGMGILPAYRTDFLVKSLEEALLRDGAVDIEHDVIEGSDGRMIPNPYGEFEMIMGDLMTTFEA